MANILQKFISYKPTQTEIGRDCLNCTRSGCN